jgi:serine-type D-Ala-D-Ala carboxypeptidase (penicillin-binding protein 5/6)
VRRGQGFAAVPLAHRGERAELVAARTVTRTARRSERLTTTLRNVPRELEGPLPAGARVGTIEVRWRGHIMARVPLVARDAVGAASLWQRADDLLGWTVAVALGVVALASLQLVLLRRRAVRRRRREAGPTSVA